VRLYLPNGMLKRPNVDLSDLTTATLVSEPHWDPDALDVVVLDFDHEPTPAEKTAIRRRLVTADAADEAHLDELLTARADPATPLWARLWLDAELAKYGEPTIN
jgi:hypothetical protein